MSMTIRRRARLEAAGRAPGGRRRPGLAAVIACYLAGAFLLLALAYALAPHPAAPPGPVSTWDYQREVVALDGGGGLNAYARQTLRATAWLTRGAIERQRDVHRLSALDLLAGAPAARRVAAWRQAHRLPLEGATLVAVLALAGWGAWRRRPGRSWLVALLVVLGATLLLTQPQAATRLAGQAGVEVPNLVLRAGVAGDPNAEVARAGGAEPAERTVAGRYWTAFVAEPLSRLQTGTTVLASAPPTGKPGLLAGLRGRVRAVGDWAVGRHGLERAVIATLALTYVLPSALLLVALAMLAACAQALVWLLLVAAPLLAPLAADPRRRRPLLRYWLLPLAAAAGLLAAAGLGALLVARAAELLHAADAEAGLLLAGSTVPVLAAALAVRRLVRRWRGRPRVIVLRGGVA
ncbi:MAG TPA: hypothetical protein VFD04_04520 [Actinomycetes bacterium]|jgi:hypothetical protein|nr:hypothetical protein [Actinomycetes bacterium]